MSAGSNVRNVPRSDVARDKAGSRSVSGGCGGANEVNDVERQIVVDHVAEKQLSSDDDGNAQTDWEKTRESDASSGRKGIDCGVYNAVAGVT